MNENLENQLISAYISEKIDEIKVISGGHINRSFLIKGKNSYVLQALNKSLYSNYLDVLIDNYNCYKSACDIFNKELSVPFEYPVWMMDKHGKYFHIDPDGNIWRMYKYIPSDDSNGNKDIDCYEIGMGLGRLHSILKSCNNIINIRTTSHLHDLSYYYMEYLNQKEECDKRVRSLDVTIEENIDRFLGVKVPAGSIIHGDAKIANMILRNGKVVGFIDLDTIMTGSVYDDIADCARSCCLRKKGKIEINGFLALIKGYEETAGYRITQEIKHIEINIEKNCFMLGLRYYTDYLSGNGYFSEEYPGQTLDKARKLLLD